MRLAVWVHALIWLCFAVLVLAPPIWLLLESTWQWSSAQDSAALLTSDQWRLLVRSLTLALTAAGIALVLGVPLALLCERTDLPGVAAWRVIGVLPLLIPPFVHALAWARLPVADALDGGWLAQHLGLPDLYSTPGVALVLALAYMPFVFLITVAGLRAVDPRMEEAGLLRVGPARVWLGVTLPLVRPHVMAGALFVFVFALVEFAVPDILRLQVYPVEIFIQFSALYDEPAAMALALPLLAITLLAVLGIGWSMRGRAFVSVGAGHGQAALVRLDRWRWLALTFCGIVALLSVGLPLLWLMVSAGPLETYVKALQSSGDGIAVSVGLSALAALLTVALGLAVALSLHGLRGRPRVGLDVLSQLPFAVPPILLGVGLIKLWNHPQTIWIYGGATILVVGYVAHFAPFAVRAAQAALSQIDPRQIDAGVLVSDPWRVLLHLLLPLLRNGLLAGGFICFVLALGELGVSLLVTPPGLAPIPIDIYNYMHYGAEDRVAALCVILVAIQFSVAALLYRLRARTASQ